jgi:hypothetical protein
VNWLRLNSAACGWARGRHGDRFPVLVATMTAAADAGQNRAFEFGLDRILDGLGVLIAQRDG